MSNATLALFLDNQRLLRRISFTTATKYKCLPPNPLAAIGYPLLQMRKVARLLPAAANIHIVTSADTHADVVAWIETSGAGLGLSAANVISNGRSSDKGYAPVADVATYIDAVKPPGHVLVLETSSVLPPQMSLQEFVGNCVTCASPVFSARLARDGEHTVGLAKLELQDPTMRGPAISGVSGFEEAYG